MEIEGAEDTMEQQGENAMGGEQLSAKRAAAAEQIDEAIGHLENVASFLRRYGLDDEAWLLWEDEAPQEDLQLARDLGYLVEDFLVEAAGLLEAAGLENAVAWLRKEETG